MDNKDLQNTRREYKKSELNEETIAQDPFVQFSKWFNEVVESKIIEPNAMTLATSTIEGKPSARIVLLKNYNESGFVFFTNYLSRKGQELSQNPSAAILFYWPEFEREVRIEGRVTKVSEEISNDYFAKRPFDSRVSAIISDQSYRINSRLELEKRVENLKKENNNLEKPKNWGGYILKPEYFEFWQGRENRLHDRICYQKNDKSWEIFRLQP